MKQNNQTIQAVTDKDVAMHVSIISIIINVVLSLLKLIAGILARSGAMISDAVHSASDVFSTIIVMIGVTIASKKGDKEHPYGHDRLECVASAILAFILAITGFGIGIAGAKKVFGGNTETLVIPGMLALVAAIISIIVKEWMYWYTRGAAKRIHSGALMADAWHHRSDALSSVGSFAGIFGARLGFPILDPIASIIICLFIEKAAWDIFKDSIDKMVDKSCSDEVIEKMKQVILDNPEPLEIDEIKTRLFGNKIYVDVEIKMNSSKTLIEAHNIAEEVHLAIEKQFPDVKHCMVHVNPQIDNRNHNYENEKNS